MAIVGDLEIIQAAFIGNSITEGYGLADAGKESYPARLKALLGSGYTVQNDGARYGIRVLDIRGSLILAAEAQAGSAGLDALHGRLEAAHGVNWISLDRLP